MADLEDLIRDIERIPSNGSFHRSKTHVSGGKAKDLVGNFDFDQLLQDMPTPTQLTVNQTVTERKQNLLKCAFVDISKCNNLRCIK